MSIETEDSYIVSGAGQVGDSLPEYKSRRRQTISDEGISTDEKIRRVVRLLQERKAEDLKVLNLDTVNNYLQYFVIATANSNTHLKGLAAEIGKMMKTVGEQKLNPLNPAESDWILLDFVDIVVQLFTPDARDYYHLEKLWGDSQDLTARYVVEST